MITIKNLRESIEDAGLHKQIDELWRFAEATYHPFQEGDSNQGVLHCTTVEKNLSYLLTESGKMDNFNDTELFLLSAAASLHDIGKIVNPDKIPIGDPYLQTETDHGKRSGYIIREHYALLGLTRPQSTVVAKIAEFHSKGKLQDLRDSKSTVTVGAIDTERLAVVFRLADNLETTSQRTPEIVEQSGIPRTIHRPNGKAARRSADGILRTKRSSSARSPNPKRRQMSGKHSGC